jgi:hypothetical protein
MSEVTERSVLIVGGRRRGRPRIGDRVAVRIPDALLDDLCREALRRQMDLSAVIRERCAAFSGTHKSRTR